MAACEQLEGWTVANCESEESDCTSAHGSLRDVWRLQEGLSLPPLGERTAVPGDPSVKKPPSQAHKPCETFVVCEGSSLQLLDGLTAVPGELFPYSFDPFPNPFVVIV